MKSIYNQLVVDKHGNVGEILLKTTQYDGNVRYITNIPNTETPNTAYLEDEIDIIDKDDVSLNNDPIFSINTDGCEKFFELYDKLDEECSCYSFIDRLTRMSKSEYFNDIVSLESVSFIEVLRGCKQVLENDDDEIAIAIVDYITNEFISTYLGDLVNIDWIAAQLCREVIDYILV